ARRCGLWEGEPRGEERSRESSVLSKFHSVAGGRVLLDCRAWVVSQQAQFRETERSGRGLSAARCNSCNSSEVWHTVSRDAFARRIQMRSNAPLRCVVPLILSANFCVIDSASAKVIFKANFETGDLSEWGGAGGTRGQNATPRNIQVV